MAAIAGVGAGTDDWEAWGGLDELRPARWGPPGRVVVIAPHAGDEVVGLGGTIRSLISAGHQVEVVNLDADGHHSGDRRAGRARRALGITPADVIDLRAGDRDEAVDVLEQRLAGASWCVTTWQGDGDPDHAAAAALARAAAARTGVPVAEYFVRTWEWAAPGDSRVPWPAARRSGFDRRSLARKEAALQVRGSLPPAVRTRLLQSFEVVLQPGAGDERPE
jgi:LmbE family N-acetylglucosaminyl deacetylase